MGFLILFQKFMMFL